MSRTFIEKLFIRWSSLGIRFPYAYDKDTRSASVTLFFAYVSFLLNCASIIAYHFNNTLLLPCLTTLGFWTIATIFYLIRTGIIKKAKIDLDDRTLELEGKEDEKAP